MPGYTNAYTDAYPPDGEVAPEPGAYPLVYPWIGKKLQGAMQAFDYFDADIKSALRDARPASVRAAGTTGDAWYASLDEEDRESVSEAAGLLVAAEMHATLMTEGAGGDLLSDAAGPVKRTYASADALRQGWRDRALRILASCSFSPPVGRTAPLPAFYAANGPSRARSAREFR